MLFRIEKLGSSPTNTEQCKICKKRLILKIIREDCSHEFCYDCLFVLTQTSDGCLQCKHSKNYLNVEKLEDKTPKIESECSICLGVKQNEAILDSCFHSFCSKCITDWSKTAKECPLCRSVFSKIYHNVKEGKTYKTFRPNGLLTSEGTSIFSTDYSSLFNTEEVHMRIKRLEAKMHKLRGVDYQNRCDNRDCRTIPNEPVQTFCYVKGSRRDREAKRLARIRDDHGDVSAARSSCLDSLGNSTETRQQGPYFQGLLDGDSSAIRASSIEATAARQSRAPTGTKRVRFNAPEEQVPSDETTTPNGTPVVRRVSENKSKQSRETVKLSKLSPTRWPRHLPNDSKNGNRDGTTDRMLPYPSNLPGNGRVDEKTEIPQKSESSSNDSPGQDSLSRKFPNR